MTVTILHGDAGEQLRALQAGSAQMCMTSPPYFNLRSYLDVSDPLKAMEMGSERTPDDFITALVDVFREVRRVLSDDGTLWVNIGDGYATNARGERKGEDCPEAVSDRLWGKHRYRKAAREPRIRNLHGIKPKDLIGIPWMLAFALRADGWFLRQEIIWHKLNPMPENVDDRPTRAHEQLFLLSKSKSYFYDAEAIAEAASENTHARVSKRARGTVVDLQTPKAAQNAAGSRNNESFTNAISGHVVQTRNKRSVWPITTQPFADAHFATYPPALVEPCILAGCPKGGTVLDPFFGAGTTGLVADRLNRNCIGIELDARSVAMAERRLSHDRGPLFEGAEA